MLYREDRGWGFSGDKPGGAGVADLAQELAALRQRVEQLEGQRNVGVETPREE